MNTSGTLISLITYCDLADLDPDDRMLQIALEKRGCRVQGLVWDDERVDWSKAGICILRSTWDYHRKFEKFCAWLKHVSAVTTLVNSFEQVMWNCRKTYLKELSDAGLPVIDTIFATKERRPEIAKSLHEKGWSEAIIKPTVGLATSGVKRIDANPESIGSGEEHLSKLLEDGEAMLQEYLPSVQDYGERSLIFINGKFSHCVRKSAFQRLAVAGEAGETTASAAAEEISAAEQIMAYLPVTPLYARVDLVRNKSNEPLLLELELVEPSLFLKNCPAAADTFADAIVAYTNCLAQPV